jgi:hypothetical protein
MSAAPFNNNNNNPETVVKEVVDVAAAPTVSLSTLLDFGAVLAPTRPYCFSAPGVASFPKLAAGIAQKSVPVMPAEARFSS